MGELKIVSTLHISVNDHENATDIDLGLPIHFRE